MKAQIISVLSLVMILFVSGTSFAQKAPKQVEPANPLIQQVDGYPNPFYNQVTATYVLTEKVEKVWVSLTDMQGRPVWKSPKAPASVGENQLPIKTTGLKPGYYYLTVHVYREGKSESKSMRLFKLWNKGEW